LPYANGNFHIGHIMEYIQADTWVRAQRMQGHEVHFVCADDAHGAPIMIAAEKAGLTPQQFVANIAAGRKPYLDGFHIGFDNWHSTDGPENHELAQQIYRDLKAAGFIATKTIAAPKTNTGTVVNLAGRCIRPPKSKTRTPLCLAPHRF
jgi:methionyl-tRNA synthetase